MNIGEKVRLLRKANQLNQKAFAEQIGISQGTLSDIKCGNSHPSTETLISIKKVFDCDLNWLLENESSKTDSDTYPTIMNS